MIVACGGNGDGGGDGNTNGGDGTEPDFVVATTLEVFADFIRQSGGDRVGAVAILPDGIDPEAEFSDDLLRQIKSARLVLYNGLDLETTAEDTLFANQTRGVQIAQYVLDVRSPTVEGESALHARDNPYLWLDPTLATTYVDTTWDSLVIIDEENRATYEANGARYKDEILAMDEELQAMLDAVPNHKIVAVGPAWEHFARHYGFDYYTLDEPISTDEPSPRREQSLLELLREEGAKAVFVEPGYSTPLLTKAAIRAKAEICTLYSDSFDDEVTSYLEMMRFNAQEIVRCLGE
jgi:zinc transport system substrate-binding protein